MSYEIFEGNMDRLEKETDKNCEQMQKVWL